MIVPSVLRTLVINCTLFRIVKFTLVRWRDWHTMGLILISPGSAVTTRTLQVDQHTSISNHGFTICWR